jgi:phosphoglycerate dehydrogenase-like enzyme
MNIVFLQPKTQQDRVFHQGHFHQLNELGKVTPSDYTVKMSSEQLLGHIRGADVAITSWGSPVVTEEVLQTAPGLKLILHAAGSVKGYIEPALWERGVRIANGSEAIGKGVAETALGLTITSLKNIWRLSQFVREGGWRPAQFGVKELYEITIGVIGGGMAGSQYIRLLQNFDVDVLLFDPLLSAAQAEAMGATKVGLDQLLERSDVVSIHAPSLPETYHLLGRDQLKAMKDDCILINTARGTIIDEQALCEELSQGRLYACLDVTDPEPLNPSSPLRKLPNVILTPHIAGAVHNGLHRLGQYVINDIKHFINGQPLRGEIKIDQLAIIA